MATTAAPYGFRPVNLIGGRHYAGSTRLIKIASAYNTNIFFGDPVKLVTAGSVEKDTGTDALTPVGIFLGCTYTDPTRSVPVWRQYWPANTVASDAMAYVCDDPFAVFQIQANGTVAQAALGANAAIVQTAGTTTIGTSKISLNYSSPDTTNTLPVRIVGFVDGPLSEVGDAYTDCLVQWRFGAHQYVTSAGI